MGHLVSLIDARSQKLKAKLCELAASRSAAVIETADGLFDAQRVVCSETAALLIDRYGVRTRIAFNEITDVSPMLTAIDIIRLAGWQVVSAEEPEIAAVLRFPTSPPG